MTILTVEDFREHVTSDLPDDAIQRLLDAAEAAINRYAGDPGDAVEVFDGGRRFYTLDRPADFILSITETAHASPSTTEVTLEIDDFYLYPSGLVVERLTTGTNYPYRRARMVITYAPKDDEAIRVGVQLDLVSLALNSNPGATMERIGDWMEQQAQSAQSNQETYWSILSRLDVGPTMLVVG